MPPTQPSYPPACPPTDRPWRRSLARSLTALAAGGCLVTAALPTTPALAAGSSSPPASASTSGQSRHLEAAEWTAKARRVLTWARRQKGKPYVYGAAGPHAFDCSGLVMYVFWHALHKRLPHNAAEQYHAVHHISRRQLRPGDLVFVDNGGYISHVGIFAGHHHWWVAPHTGTRVHRQRIYPAHFVYGRAIRWPSRR